VWGEAQIRANDGGTVADFLAAARAAAIVGDHDRAHAICVNLYRRLFASAHSLFASEHSYVGFVNMLLREGLAGTAEALVRDFTLTLQRAGQTKVQEALLGDATSWFADNPWFATEYALLASQRGNFAEAAYRWEAVRSRWPDRAPRNLPVPAANDKAFANIVADLDVDEATFQCEMLQERPSDRNYIIVFTPRSGSTWLTSILAATQLLGQPQEYINPDFVANVAKEMNSKDPSGLLAILRRRRKSANGVFGLKVTAIDVVLYGEAEFYDAFDADTVVFNLWRDNLVAQGISLYRAVSTEGFHSWAAADAVTATPVYDPAHIGLWVQHVADYENQNMLMLARHACCPRSLRYEDIVRSSTTAISIFADAMRVDLPVGQLAGSESGALRKIGDDWNRTTELRFRREEAEFVRNIEARRLIKREP
jgi:LPS sulfotransferase NodH